MPNLPHAGHGSNPPWAKNTLHPAATVDIM